MKIKIQKVSGTVLYALIIITLVVLGLFYFGGEAEISQRVVADTSMSEPAQTNALLFWNYALLGIAILALLVAAIYKFVAGLMDSPKDALKSLLGIVVIAVVLIVAWTLGSGNPLVIPAYDGTDNVYFWLKLTDMWIYTVYFEVAVLILLMLGFGIAKRFK
ncbi:MAG: hypothetical protein LBL78_05435 [Prevotellaceae bacterium]|jgi:hypothetical protein|nr:hypothetical protein [Prevotellaceae bacterium]